MMKGLGGANRVYASQDDGVRVVSVIASEVSTWLGSSDGSMGGFHILLSTRGYDIPRIQSLSFM